MEISNADFENLWMEISEALLRIAGQKSSAKREEWKKSFEKFFHEPLTPDSKKCLDELRLCFLMDMDTKDKLEKLDEKMEQIRHEQRHLEILILLESLKANGPVASSSPLVESAQLNVWRHVYLYLQSSHQSKMLRVYPQARNCKPQVSEIVQ